MAALRHGVHTVIIPKDNERDLEEIDQTVRKALQFVVAETVDTVLDTALNRTVEPVAAFLGGIPQETMTKSRKPDLRQ